MREDIRGKPVVECDTASIVNDLPTKGPWLQNLFLNIKVEVEKGRFVTSRCLDGKT